MNLLRVLVSITLGIIVSSVYPNDDTTKHICVGVMGQVVTQYSSSIQGYKKSLYKMHSVKGLPNYFEKLDILPENLGRSFFSDYLNLKTIQKDKLLDASSDLFERTFHREWSTCLDMVRNLEGKCNDLNSPDGQKCIKDNSKIIVDARVKITNSITEKVTSAISKYNNTMVELVDSLKEDNPKKSKKLLKVLNDIEDEEFNLKGNVNPHKLYFIHYLAYSKSDKHLGLMKKYLEEDKIIELINENKGRMILFKDSVTSFMYNDSLKVLQNLLKVKKFNLSKKEKDVLIKATLKSKKSAVKKFLMES